jgi:hypothetical protein
MTRQPTDKQIHPRGHLIRKGSALHRTRHSDRNVQHDLETALVTAKREQRHQAGRAAKTKHGHGTGHAKPPTGRKRRD